MGCWKRPCITSLGQYISKPALGLPYSCIPVLAALAANSLSEFPPVESKMRNLSLSCSLFNQTASVAEVKWGENHSSSASPPSWPALPSTAGQTGLCKQQLDLRCCLLKHAVKGSILCSIFLHCLRSIWPLKPVAALLQVFIFLNRDLKEL